MSIALDETATSGFASKLTAAAGGLVLLVALLAAGAGAGIASLVGGGNTAPSASATSAIPPAMLALYQQAATTCPGLPWTVLAAIGTIESDNGQSTPPGVQAGLNFAGVAEGPMQFEPATFAAYDEPVPPGGANPSSPYDPTDAAARMLCASGANLSASVYAYNHSDSYVAAVLSLAQTYGQTQAQTVATGTAGGIALDWALAQVGTPYIWGGETPAFGFDCSGLVQAAYKVAGTSLPRVAQDQYDAGPQLPAGTPLEPGDLVFFGGGPQSIDTLVSSSPPASWSTPPTPAPTSEKTSSPPPSTVTSEACSTWAPPGRTRRRGSSRSNAQACSPGRVAIRSRGRPAPCPPPDGDVRCMPPSGARRRRRRRGT